MQRFGNNTEHVKFAEPIEFAHVQNNTDLKLVIVISSVSSYKFVFLLSTIY